MIVEGHGQVGVSPLDSHQMSATIVDENVEIPQMVFATAQIVLHLQISATLNFNASGEINESNG